MNEKFFSELSRCLKRESIAIGEMEDERLPVLLDSQAAMWIGSKGTIFLKSELAHDQSCTRLYDRVAGVSAQVHEYTTAIAAAPRLKAEGLHENFHLLSEYNGLVLAGREMEGGLGYEFATWWYTYDRAGVTQGNYHYDYGTAKLDFACRAGLVEKHRQFTDEQLVEMYRCIHETLDGEYPSPRIGMMYWFRRRSKSSEAWTIWTSASICPTGRSWRRRTSRMTALDWR